MDENYLTVVDEDGNEIYVKFYSILTPTNSKNHMSLMYQ